MLQNEHTKLKVCSISFTARHAYQRACIDFPNMLVLDVEKETLEKWKEEFDNYTNDESKGYDSQEIEKDANEFADRLILDLKKEDVESC
jgi:hypothetical protein